MLENNVSVAKVMIDEFEKQFNSIHQDYQQRKISSLQCVQALNWLRMAWEMARIDIKNNGHHNKVATFQYDDGVDITFPGWYSDEQGQGAQIRVRKTNTKIIFNCINEGNIKFNFRGVDYKDNKNTRLPVYFNYSEIKINNSSIINKEQLSWHDKPIIYNKKCQNNEQITMEIICKNIYNYYPSLKAYLLNINKANLEESLNNLIEYIKNEKDVISINNNEQLIQTNIKLLNKRNEELFLKFEEYKAETNNIIESYNFLFNTLFKYNKIEPQKLVQLSRELNMQMLDFIDNICKKHNMQWWLYAGTLLGAIRHKGFIPWDDDCDIKMMRDDYEKFLQIIGNEIKEHNLQDFMEANTTTKTIDDVLLPFIKLNYWVDKHLYAFIDIFPTEYLKEEAPNIETIFEVETNRMVGRLRAGEDRQTVISEASERLSVSKTKTDKIICGIEDSIFAIHDYDTIFPLKKIQFENRQYPCPNHYLTYVSKLYGDNYMQIPKQIYAHGFYDYLSRLNNVYQRMEEHIKKLDEINKNF